MPLCPVWVFTSSAAIGQGREAAVLLAEPDARSLRVFSPNYSVSGVQLRKVSTYPNTTGDHW